MITLNLEKPRSAITVLARPGSTGSHRPLMLILLAFLLAMTMGHLMFVKAGFPDFRGQHLGTALEYAKGRINLLQPIIVGFNANDQPTPQEVPLWQASVAILFKLFGTWLGWANIASLAFFALGLWPLYRLACQYLGERAAWWTLIFYCAQPLIFLLGGQAGTDGFCHTLALFFLYYADVLVRTGAWRAWFGAMIFGVLAAVTKLPFFFCVGLASFFLLLLHDRRSAQRWLQLASIGGTALIALMIWTRYCNACISRAEFPFVDLRLSNTDVGAWYFGSWSYRLNPANWVKGGWRILNTLLGSFVLVALPLWSLLRSRTRLGHVWLAACVLTTFVFTHLVLHHHHYFLMFAPAVAMLCADAAARLEETVGLREFKARGWALAGVSVILLAATIQGLIGINLVLLADPQSKQVSGWIRQYTRPEDKLLVEEGGWGGEQLFLTNRKGLSIWSTDFLENAETLARIKALGYTKLVMISESFLHHAVQATKPGQLQLQRDVYQAHLTPVVQSWPTVFQNDDILIKELPK